MAALEFALVAPFLVLLLLGGFDLSRYILVQQKVDKMAFTVADTISREQILTSSMANQLFVASAQLMKPFDFGANGLVILSAVARNEDESKLRVKWQCKGGGTLEAASRIGKIDDIADVPGDLTLDAKDYLIITEVFYEWTPPFGNFFLGDHGVYKYAMFRPRLGQLTTTAGCL
ncbi:TadE/TadG family type IV pilus assembly protein [Afifella aestuarii]|uniref:TadE/TadG family type IV pilus assembly protein n=1 Tax=Afifella aestuarii TaxID=1909496 RepID=UPI0013E34496|nr:TadE/TadG family type IV pilus assembly protein [Afifella aestuarii]